MLSFAAHPMHVLPITMDTLMQDAFMPMRACPREATRIVEQDDGTYALALAAPGVKHEDLKVSVTDENILEIKGESRARGGAGVRSIRWSSRLPSDVDTTNITASVVDGIVSLTLPKKQKAPPIQIALSTTNEEGESDDEDSTYSLLASLPGLAASDLELRVSDSILHCNGATKKTGARVAKMVRLPRDADAANARASLVDGLLTISLPKLAPEVKTISVSTAAPEEPAGAPNNEEDLEMA